MVKRILLSLLMVSFTLTADAALINQPSPFKRAGTTISPNVSTDRITGNGTVPQGVIALWSGTIASIPTGWELSDGTCAITCPDLRNLFVVGANADSGGAAKSTIAGAAAQTGGSTTIAQANLPAVGLTVSMPLSSPNTGGSSGVPQNTPGPADTTSNTYTTSNMGSGTAYVQPFYALAYIIKD